MDLNADQVINDQFIPAPKESELMYVFSSRPYDDLYWSLPVFPGKLYKEYISQSNILDVHYTSHFCSRQESSILWWHSIIDTKVPNGWCA